jgi:membrane-bound lytic murein transglycosylase B
MALHVSIKRGLAAAVLLAGVVFAPAGQAKDFTAWLGELRRDAVAAGISQKTVDAALPDGLRPIPRIIELDRKQPEKTRTLGQYLDSIVSADRKDKGRTRYLNNKALLHEVGDKYGVDPATIVALWGVETNYGAITGGYQVIPALATLAYDGRRADFFRGELMKALKIVDEDHISLDRFKGSWAGAMGQCQFMPSSFMRFAVDHNGDGRRDIWGTEADVFASAANYLSQSGWKRGQVWGHEVMPPRKLDRSLVGVDKEYPLSFWRERNIRGLNGQPVAADAALKASLIQPDGPEGRAFLVYDNYKVIMKWNKSTYFATSVGLLSDHIRTGKSAVARPTQKPAAPVSAPTAPASDGERFNN